MNDSYRKGSGQRRRALETKRRASTPDPKAMACVYCMDGTPSERRAGKGLSPRMCLRHRERFNRHGHPLKPSWRATEVQPYIRLAERFIRDVITGKSGAASRDRSTPPAASSVVATVRAYRAMITSAGASRRHLPRTPHAKARAILGRLRAKYLLPPEDEARTTRWKLLEPEALAIKVAAVVVGMELAHQHDPAPGGARFLAVQIGKAVHRLAGGHHRTFITETQQPAADPYDSRTWWREPQPLIITEQHAYDGSRGKSVLHLGTMLQERNLITEKHRRELTALMADRIPVTPIENWTDRRALEARSKKGGKRRRPYKPVGQRGHDRVRRK